MAADQSALVPLVPDDTVDTILRKIHAARASSVELLVPDDTAALQAPRGFERLRRALDDERIGLLVISSDDQTLAAARRNGIETVVVQGVRVQPAAPQPPRAGRRTAQTQPTPIDARDAAFLEALDQVPAGESYADLQDDDADLYAAIDDLPDSFDSRGGYAARPGAAADRQQSDDDFAAELDTWSDESSADTLAAPAEPRYSAADFDLADDVARRRSGRRATGQRDRAAPRSTGARSATGQRDRATRPLYDEDVDAQPALRRLGLRLLPVVVVLLIALALIFWLLASRVTVTVTPPTASAAGRAFTNEVLGRIGSDSTATETAVQADPVAADAEATVAGQVTKETQAPVGIAKGEVTIANTIESAVPLPKGAEFIGKNERGEEVRFTLDNDVTIPPAVTSSSLSGRSTTYGQVNVPVTARSPGAASNVPENSIKQILIPGQQPIVSDSSNFLIRHGPIGGGTDLPQRIVTEDDVQAVLQDALTQLYNNGIQQLRGQIDESKLAIDASTVTPSAADLASPESYQISAIEPAVGQTVDPANPAFNVTVRAHFSALATPLRKSVSEQLQTIVPKYFQQRSDSPCKVGEQQATSVSSWHWDGQRLTIDGAISCQPAGGLPAETVDRVRSALVGQSSDTAEAGLRTLQQQGLIGSYQLPAGRASFPRFGWLITVEVGQPQLVEPEPTQKATS